MLGHTHTHTHTPGGVAIHAGNASGARLLEAKFPAQLFQQQLGAFVEKTYCMLRDGTKHIINPQLVRPC